MELPTASQHKGMTYTNCCIYRVVPPDDDQQACSKRVEVNYCNTLKVWFPFVYKGMLRWFPSFQVATKFFSCSPPDLNILVTYICVHVK